MGVVIQGRLCILELDVGLRNCIHFPNTRQTLSSLNPIKHSLQSQLGIADVLLIYWHAKDLSPNQLRVVYRQMEIAALRTAYLLSRRWGWGVRPTRLHKAAQRCSSSSLLCYHSWRVPSSISVTLSLFQISTLHFHLFQFLPLI